MVDGGGLENRWMKVSRVRILLPPPIQSPRKSKEVQNPLEIAGFLLHVCLLPSKEIH